MKCSRCGEDNALVAESCFNCGRSLLARPFARWKRSLGFGFVCLYAEGLFHIAYQGGTYEAGMDNMAEMFLYSAHRFLGPIVPQVVAVGGAIAFFTKSWREWQRRDRGVVG